MPALPWDLARFYPLTGAEGPSMGFLSSRGTAGCDRTGRRTSLRALKLPPENPANSLYKTIFLQLFTGIYKLCSISAL